MPNLGATELIIILLIVVLLFGSKKLPDLARSIGSSMRELRKGVNDEGQSEKASDAKKSV
jgi:sec-independent protein translocase protein TatA